MWLGRIRLRFRVVILVLFGRLSCYRIVFVVLCCRMIDLLHPQQCLVFMITSQSGQVLM